MDLGSGSVGQDSTFSENGHVAYLIKENHKMQQHGRKCFARRSPTLGMGSVGQNSSFSENSDVAYQIKENHEYSKHSSKFLPTIPSP